MMRNLVYSLASACLVAASAAFADPVTVAQGMLAGTQDGAVAAFKDIPYAAPPLGNLRWMPPAPGPHWQGVRDGSHFGPTCPQEADSALMARAPQSEDCLSLNVWSPDLKGKLPVMVFIHGGGFSSGSASRPLYDGAELAGRGVVIVTFNYRLGYLGFLALPSLHEKAADFGLLDQVAALKWVRDNIAAFGGDPANVTIFGESAGAVSVDALMASPLARGLFAKAIAESGPVMPDDALTRADAERDGAAFAAKLGTAPRAASVDAILAAQKGDDLFSPILDGVVLNEEPTVAFYKGNIAKVPYLAGWNSNEATLLGNAPADWILKDLGDKAAEVRAIYEKNGKLSDLDFAHQLFTDAAFGASAEGLAAFAARAGAPAYVYHFAFLPDLLRRRGATGVPHGGELPFVFGFGVFTDFAPPQDIAVKNMVETYWTDFAKTGDPNGKGVPHWPRVAEPQPQTLVIGDKTAAVADFHKERVGVGLVGWAKKQGVTLTP